ncbi:MAG: adenosylcobalamin-dependent ribonucleoside-diphosphate reductase [Deltaproteobacteria bacterium]|nr:adenosylcobalamin-dependent ribonucleoside-diphosphate reductase [Deltaproteobacteria bacterium]
MKEILTPNALTVLGKRYLKKDSSGNAAEGPEDMFRRVAANIASAESAYGHPSKKAEEEFYEMMTSLEFLPNSPTLMNAGRKLQQLAACFVLPIEDSIESIFKAVRDTAVIHQSGGGTGFSFSRLRPANDTVESTGGMASGPISFMRVFNTATEAIKQGGTRRGANMGVLSVHHPDIRAFITAKDDPKEFANFNLSVSITEEFMRALRSGEPYPLTNPHTGKISAMADAAEMFSLIATSAWKGGEPGILFIDAINTVNPTPRQGAMEATNPCGEQPLLPYEACNLGSINLSRMLKKSPGREWSMDFDKLARTVHTAVRFLDNTIDMCKYPLQEIDKTVRGNRKIGLGVMGFADMLIRLGIPYGSEASLSTAEEVMGFINKTAKKASASLAKERGAYPSCEAGHGARNATVTTIAPTGTLSIIAGCSSGIEPLYALSYDRRALGNITLHEMTPLLEEALFDEGFLKEEILKHVREGKGLGERPDVPEKIKRLFVTAEGISPDDHVRVQAAFQRHTDNAVSKTVNLSSASTPEDVMRVYLLAYELGCKGITVYRSRSRTEQVLSCKDTPYC